MTTIAASVKHGVMVSDSKVTYSNNFYTTRKIFTIKRGLLGTAGDIQLTSPFEVAILAGQLPVRPAEADKEASFDGLLLTHDGIVVFDEYYNEIPIYESFAAIGSGASVALSWLINGATPQEAIERACEVDDASGLPVQVEMLTKRTKK